MKKHLSMSSFYFYLDFVKEGKFIVSTPVYIYTGIMKREISNMFIKLIFHAKLYVKIKINTPEC